MIWKHFLNTCDIFAALAVASGAAIEQLSVLQHLLRGAIVRVLSVETARSDYYDPRRDRFRSLTK